MIFKNPVVGVGANVGGLVDPIPHFKIGPYEILAFTATSGFRSGCAVAVINHGFKEYELLGMFSLWGNGGLEAAIFCLNALHKSDEVWSWACKNFGDGRRKPREFGSKQESFCRMTGRLGALGWRDRVSVNLPGRITLANSQANCSIVKNCEVGHYH